MTAALSASDISESYWRRHFRYSGNDVIENTPLCFSSNVVGWFHLGHSLEAFQFYRLDRQGRQYIYLNTCSLRHVSPESLATRVILTYEDELERLSTLEKDYTMRLLLRTFFYQFEERNRHLNNKREFREAFESKVARFLCLN